MTSWRQRVRYLEQQLEQKDAIILRQSEKIRLLEQHVLHLENKLRKYINENTPSSQKPNWDKDKSSENKDKETKDYEGKPKGKPEGSNGATREIPKIENEKIVRLDGYEDYFECN